MRFENTPPERWPGCPRGIPPPPLPQKYLEALLTATHRYGLQGQELEEVTVEQQQFAQTKLTEYAENKNKFITAKKSFYLKKR